ncbi:class I SAM-dependent methyltransferase [Paracoccus salsus]|uniref:class I SAM-dependent methyltransferase n=1 Tax=Paracoccus salsus TaxID=2911061 RepID=UPI001F17F8E9|nr:class I SAM-dependent methyltransferase [Paracoccus salsus]MCF3972467.1 class I SAM-dependent methyltransferase [Paracoccus salsus]
MDWNERFGDESYHYGEAPATFVKTHMRHLGDAARVLTIAEGEGRNAVWLAAQGYRVTAVEPTEAGRRKALDLAARHAVSIEWRAEDLAEFAWPDEAFDAALGCFFQFAGPEFRARILVGLGRSVRPGGQVFLHGFSTRQMANSSGGPRVEAQLWTVPMILASFPGWQVIRAEDHDAILDEGQGHAGLAALIDVIVKKPA